MGRFTVYRADRNRQGGGAALLIHTSIISRALITESFSDLCQVAGAILTVQSQNILVFLIYRSPSCHPSDFNTCLETVYELAAEHQFPLLVMGDFNCPLIDWNNFVCPSGNSTNTSLLSFSQCLSLHQLVRSPTRNNNILDLVFCSVESLVSSLTVSPPLPSLDHNTIQFHLNLSLPRTPSRTSLCYSKGNWDLACSLLARTDWPSLLSLPTLDEAYDAFTNHLLSIVEHCVPIVTNHDRQNKFSSRAKNLLTRCQKLYRDRQTIGIQPYLKLSKRLRKIVSRDKRESERSMIKSKHKKRLFQFATRNIRNKSSVIGALSSPEGTIHSTDQEKANALAVHFSNCFNSSTIPSAHTPSYTTPSLDFVHFDAAAIYKVLANLPRKASSSPDNINYFVLKECALPLALPLSMLFHRSLLIGCIPSIWKKAIVIPIYKNKGSRHDPTNYRPISLTCSISKVMERLVCAAVQSHLSSNSLLCPEQHGFTSRRSCVTSLLTTLKKIHIALEKKQFVSCAYIDFSRAFDSLPLNLLIDRCRSSGLSGSLLNWISSFLSDRTQSVRVGSSLSHAYPVLSGVPQGSCLGPLLFSLYISDISKIFPSSVAYSLFADDLKLFSFSDPPLLQSALDALSSFATSRGLTISATKSVVMHIGRSHPPFSFSVNGSILPRHSQFRDLGITYTDSLSFQPHIQELIAKSKARCAYIYRSFSSRSISLYALLFKTYVRPLLEYGSVVWDCGKRLETANIEKIQAQYTRICQKKCRKPYTSYPDRLELFTLERLETRRRHIDLSTTYKIIHKLIDIDPRSMFVIPTRKSRSHSKHLYPDISHSARYSEFFSNRVVSSWNVLTEAQVSAPSFALFNASLT